MMRRSRYLLLCLLATSTNATSHLRPMVGPDAEPKETLDAVTYKQGVPVGTPIQRYLQGSTTVLNSLINVFLPNLAETIKAQVGQTADPLNLNYETSDDQGEVQLKFNSTFCNATMADALITYELGSMTGLSNMDVKRLELVQGSENIDLPLLSFLGAQGAKWSGEFLVQVDFVRFNAQTTATLANTFCAFTFEEVLEGNSVMRDPTGTARIYLAGETSNIYSFSESTQLNQATIKDLTLGYGTLNPQLGTFVDLVTLDADAPLIEIGQAGLAGELGDYIQSELQKGIDNELPYTL